MSDLTKITYEFGRSLLRNLDVDDLYVLAYLYETGKAHTSILAKTLKLTDPALSHRYAKYLKIFGEDILTASPRGGRCRVLTDIGREKIKPCANAFKDIFGEV